MTTKIRTPRGYPCPVCGKRTISRDYLDRCGEHAGTKCKAKDCEKIVPGNRIYCAFHAHQKRSQARTYDLDAVFSGA